MPLIEDGQVLRWNATTGDWEPGDALGPNDYRVMDVSAYGTLGTADDSAVIQAALDAAKVLGHVYLKVPPNAQMIIASKLQLNAARGVVFGTDAPDGYAYSAAGARLIWNGAAGGTMFEMLGTGSCEIRGLGFEMGTADRAIDIDAGGAFPSTSNIVRGCQIVKAASDANSVGVGLSTTSAINNERHQIYNTAIFFGGSVNPATLTRGTAIQIGAAGGMGVNAKNIFLQNVYWFGCSYGVDLWNAEVQSFSCQSNFASIDYLANSGTLIVQGHNTETARQFVKGRNNITLIANRISFGGWDNAFPIVEMTHPGVGGGSGGLLMISNRYDAQAGVNAVDADNTGNYFINHAAANNAWPDTTPTFSNFTQYAESFDTLQVRDVLFANLAAWVPPTGFSAMLYCSDATPGTNPATGGGTGAMVIRQAGVWVALPDVAAPPSVAAVIYNNADINLYTAGPVNAETVITFNSEVQDPNGVHSTASNTSRFTAPSTGFYRFGFNAIELDSGGLGTAYCIVKFYINGSLVYGQQSFFRSADAAFVEISANAAFYLTASDYVEVTITPGQATSPVLKYYASRSPYFTMERVGS